MNLGAVICVPCPQRQTFGAAWHSCSSGRAVTGHSIPRGGTARVLGLSGLLPGWMAGPQLCPHLPISPLSSSRLVFAALGVSPPLAPGSRRGSGLEELTPRWSPLSSFEIPCQAVKPSALLLLMAAAQDRYRSLGGSPAAPTQTSEPSVPPDPNCCSHSVPGSPGHRRVLWGITLLAFPSQPVEQALFPASRLSTRMLSLRLLIEEEKKKYESLGKAAALCQSLGCRAAPR